MDDDMIYELIREMARQIVGGNSCRMADLVIAPDGNPYLYRWHVVPRNSRGNVMFHIPVANDPERPLHDHPWDGTSTFPGGTRSVSSSTAP